MCARWISMSSPIQMASPCPGVFHHQHAAPLFAATGRFGLKDAAATSCRRRCLYGMLGFPDRSPTAPAIHHPVPLSRRLRCGQAGHVRSQSQAFFLQGQPVPILGRHFELVSGESPDRQRQEHTAGRGQALQEDQRFEVCRSIRRTAAPARTRSRPSRNHHRLRLVFDSLKYFVSHCG